MRDLTHSDPLQAALVTELRKTEALLSLAASTESGRTCGAEITALPDLGLANNIQRMLGGFFTGGLYRWETDVPIVPIDATVNVCSVSLHKLSDPPEDEDEFLAWVARGIAVGDSETSYDWNFDRGNHFISVVETGTDSRYLMRGHYLLMHSSACEFKKQRNGLYPTPNNWYAGDVRAVSIGDKQLRYISGSPAEKFHELARSLVQFNEFRHEVFARLIADAQYEFSVKTVPHYGMPDASSVAVGCQWIAPEDEWAFLLTQPDRDVYCVASGDLLGDPEGNWRISPHGLGNTTADRVTLESDFVAVGSERFGLGDELSAAPNVHVRDLDEIDVERDYLRASGSDRLATLTPLFSYYGRRPMLTTDSKRSEG